MMDLASKMWNWPCGRDTQPPPMMCASWVLAPAWDLVNIQRCVDSMKLESTWGKGTRLRMKLFLNPDASMGEGHTTH